MNARRVLFAAVLLLMMAGSRGPLLAHHSFSMFDMEKDVTYEGVVVEFMWINPHVHFILEVKPGSERDLRKPRTLRDGSGKPIDYDGNYVYNAGGYYGDGGCTTFRFFPRHGAYQRWMRWMSAVMSSLRSNVGPMPMIFAG